MIMNSDISWDLNMKWTPAPGDFLQFYCFLNGHDRVRSRKNPPRLKTRENSNMIQCLRWIINGIPCGSRFEFVYIDKNAFYGLKMLNRRIGRFSFLCWEIVKFSKWIISILVLEKIRSYARSIFLSIFFFRYFPVKFWNCRKNFTWIRLKHTFVPFEILRSLFEQNVSARNYYHDF